MIFDGYFLVVIIIRRLALNDHNGIWLRTDIETRTTTNTTLAAVNRELIPHVADGFAFEKNLFGAKFDTKTTGFAKFRFDNDAAAILAHLSSHLL
jgi:hypothetical protein